jgi:hypothetical protein
MIGLLDGKHPFGKKEGNPLKETVLSILFLVWLST